MTSKSKIVVTGAAGMIGRHVMHALSCVPSISPLGIVRSSGAFEFENYIVSDLESRDNVQALRKYEPHVIVHAAARLPISFDDEIAASINALIDANVLELAKQTGASLIYLSSSSVYADTVQPWSEKSRIGKLPAYANGKYETEEAVIGLVQPSAAIRISSPYSLLGLERQSVLYKFVKKAVAGEDLFVLGSGKRSQDFIHAHDIGVAITKIAMNFLSRNPSFGGEVYNIASGKSVDMLSLAEMIIEISGKGRIVQIGEESQEDHYQASMVVDHARSKLGWTPAIPLESGIGQLVRRLRGENENWFSV